jgi:D-alanyl-D-alanine carboxypeptidase
MNRRDGQVATWLVVTLVVSSACSSTGTGARPPATNPDETTATPTGEPLDRQALLDRGREVYGSPGGLAVVYDEDGQWFGASGEADLAGTEIGLATRFRIGSITKPIVAALVLDAVADGDIALDDTVSDLVPGELRADPPISVRMLLDHTSGVFDQLNEGSPADIDRLPDAEMRTEARSLVRRYADGEQVIAPDRLLVALAETHDRYFPPGTGYHYSNTNYQLAVMVLEAATGAPLADLMRERIVRPLGLEHTTVAPSDIESPSLRGYTPGRRDGTFNDITDDLIGFGNGGNGGIISTGEELLTIIRAIVSGRLVRPPLLTEMTTMTSQSNSTYGLGLAMYELSCGTFFGHGGSVNGTVSLALADASANRAAVIAFNLVSPTDPELPALADDLLCGKGR